MSGIGSAARTHTELVQNTKGGLAVQAGLSLFSKARPHCESPVRLTVNGGARTDQKANPLFFDSQIKISSS